MLDRPRYRTLNDAQQTGSTTDRDRQQDQDRFARAQTLAYP